MLLYCNEGGGEREYGEKGGEEEEAYQAGEWKFEKEEIGGALVAADFAQGKGAGFVAAGLARARFFLCGWLGMLDMAFCCALVG